MAESIALHLLTTDVASVEAVLNVIARRAQGTGTVRSWSFPPEESGCVTYFCEEVAEELELAERAQVVEALGGSPFVSLCIEFSRSGGEISLQATERLAVSLLNRFQGVANDLVGTIWSLSEVKAGRAGKRFLDAYRT